uniref:serine hydrolase n=1 Tax=Gelidibacter sp. TaxID=2018083 RepID=UPI00404A52D5
MKLLFKIFLLFLASSCSGQSNSNTNKDVITKVDKIKEIISLYSDYGGFNGAVAISHQDSIIFKEGFGLANMEWNIANESDTKFQIASLTKSFTAMLIMQLVNEGKLDLHKPIALYLPEYPEEAARKITIHQLLTHTSGIPNVKNDKKVNRPNDMVSQFSNEPLKFEPGENFDYSNSGYTLLGYIIENVTNKSYEEVLEEKIFKPLMMQNSGFYRNGPIIKNLSSGYNKWYGDYFDTEKTDESSAYSAGGLYSTVEDMMLWSKALNNETLLPKKYMDLIFTKHSPDNNDFYGYGWELKKRPIGNTDEFIETAGHGGNIDGYRASFIRVPSTNSSIVLFSNTSYAFLNAINQAVIGILNEKPYDYPLKPIALFMNRKIESEGIEKAILFYKENKDNAEYYVSEEELIVSGYKFLQNENTDYAIKIFKLCIDVFPNNYNPYDSYAEALMTIGKNKEAIDNYKKSLELNPNNKNAENMIEKLKKEFKE